VLVSARPDLDDAIEGVGRRLDLFAEDSRTRFDLLTEKLVTGLTAITNQMTSIALDVGQLMNERADNRRRLDDHEKRIAALETKSPRRKPRKK
jgi:hypothetical protein